jgi:sugar phosphate permease
VFRGAGGADRALVIASLAAVGALLFAPDSLLAGAAAQDAGGPHAAATATGFVNGLGSIGAIVEGLLLPWVSRTYGWTAAFSVLVGMALLGALTLVPAVLREKKA